MWNIAGKNPILLQIKKLRHNTMNPGEESRTLRKELEKAPGTIVYLGNSITAQKESYRHPLHGMIVRYFNRIHRPVNAGLGGVGSLACAFLVEELVLRHHPVLCFVECSAADTGGTTPLDSVGPSVEGILRQLITGGVRVVLLHLFRRDDMALHKKAVLEVYDALAGHYQVPSIDLNEVITAQLTSGKVREEELFHDGIHTTRNGSGYISELIFDRFKTFLDQPLKTVHPLPAAFYEIPYQYTLIQPVTGEMAGTGAPLSRNSFRDLVEYTEILPGMKLSVPTGLNYLRGIMIVADADSGVVNVETDGKLATFQTWDEWCFMPRIQAIIPDQAVPPGSLVQISVSVSSSGEKTPQGTPSRHIKQGKNMKIIGLMMYSAFLPERKKLFG